MNLLPKDHSEFVKPEYWDQFFKKRGSKAFEWYGEYPELCGVLHKYIKAQDKLLVVGCGNSQLSADLYDVGYHSIVNIDISDTVIRQMVDKNAQQRPEMKFLKMDVLNLELSNGEFSVVLDKGTLDALMVDTTEKVVTDIERMFEEIDRVLKMMGRYICISLLQEHILDKVLRVFADKGWAVRIQRINTDESGNSNKDFHMPVFALIFTKFKKSPNMPQVLEVCSVEGKNERFSNVSAVKDAIKEMQYYAVVRQRISQRKSTKDQLSLELHTDDSSTPRYTLTIVDAPTNLKNKFAIFIVPQGRETEWMFSTDAGRCQLSESAGFERLIVVALHRNNTYTNLDTIQSELSAKVMELAPPGFKPGTKVPFLSLGSDIGSRTICAEGHSEISGDYVVEEVAGDNGVMYRRLIFLANQNVVQSEAKLKTGKKRKGKQPALTIDKSYLACQHHISMVTGLAVVQGSDWTKLIDGDMSVLLIGLGGGGLPTYIHQLLPQVQLDVVDIDPAIVSIATSWFGFTPDDKLKAHVVDGLQYVLEDADKGVRRHVIMLDVDSKDTSVGMSCPPQPFVEQTFLQAIKTCLYPGGVLVLNLVCRDENLKQDVVSRIQSLFPVCFIQDIEGEVNDIIYAMNFDPRAANPDDVSTGSAMTEPGMSGASCEDRVKQSKDMLKQCGDNVRYLNRYVKQVAKTSDTDFIEQMEGMRIL